MVKKQLKKTNSEDKTNRFWNLTTKWWFFLAFYLFLLLILFLMTINNRHVKAKDLFILFSSSFNFIISIGIVELISYKFYNNYYRIISLISTALFYIF